jgi:hypothetical protein
LPLYLIEKSFVSKYVIALQTILAGEQFLLEELKLNHKEKSLIQFAGTQSSAIYNREG